MESPDQAPRHATEAPCFLVGQDQRGQWLVVETHGLGGGFFLTRDAALHFARDATERRPSSIAPFERSASASTASADIRDVPSISAALVFGAKVAQRS